MKRLQRNSRLNHELTDTLPLWLVQYGIAVSYLVRSRREFGALDGARRDSD